MKSALVLCGVMCLAQPNTLTPREEREGWRLLFNGGDLAGWQGMPGVWTVHGGAIVGSTDKSTIAHNTFLIHGETFGDFVLRAEVKLRNGNSGVHFRSRQLDGPGWIITGYQADFSDAGERSAWGNFYEERGRGRSVMKTVDEGWQKARDHVRAGDWNQYEILAQGRRIRLTLNGVVTIDTTDGKSSSGVIALQIHSGPPMQAEFRNLKIKILK